MISKENIEAIKIIAEKLNPEKINWALIGSSNLALQGVDVEAHDIDILTDKEGALEMGKLLKEFTIEYVAYKESEKFKSYYGKFVINGVEVEIMGQLQNINPVGDLWSESTNLSEKIYIKVDDMEIPAISLKQEYQAYLQLGRQEKAEKIAKVLQSNA